MTADRQQPLDRLTRALRVYLDRDAGDPESVLSEHEDLKDLLEPMLRATEEQPAEGAPRLGEFRLLREIGRGGMGVVYEAEDLALERRVALKVLAAHLTLSAKQIARFRRGATAAARLRHPGIVPIYGVGEDGGTHYFAQELVNGPTLHERLSQTAASRPQVAWITQIVRQVAEALDYAHRQGVIHRDVKPRNILLQDDDVPRLVDFGLAKDLSRAALSEDGEVAGTPHYVSPEQALGRPDLVDARSDVFALGVMLYEMLAHRRPFEGDSSREILARVAQCTPRPLREHNSKIPRDLSIICHKALQPEPRHRYQTASEFAADLTRFAKREPIAARPPSAWLRTRRLVQRHPARTATLALVLVSVSGAVGFAVRAERRDEQQHEEKLTTLAQLRDALVKGGAFHEPGQETFYLEQMRGIVTGYEDLLVDHPDDPRVVIDLISALGLASESYGFLGRESDAHAACTRIVNLIENRLPHRTTEVRFALGRALARRASIRTRGDATEQRLADCDGAVEHLRFCVEQEPARPEFRAKLAAALASRAVETTHYVSPEHDNRHAEAELCEAIDLWAPLEDEHRRGEPFALLFLGKLYQRNGRDKLALAQFERCVARADEILRTLHGDRRLRSILVKAHLAIGFWHAMRFDRDRAERSFRVGLTVTSELERDFPSAPMHRADRASMLLELSILATRNDGALATELMHEARSIANDLLTGDSQSLSPIVELRARINAHAVSLSRENDPAAARILQRDAVARYRALLDTRWSRTHANELANQLTSLANFALEDREFDRARDLAREALALRRRTADESKWARGITARAYEVLVRALGETGELTAQRAAMAELAEERTR